MEQTTMNRGHLAFLEDQLHAAVEAFKAGELADVPTILQSVAQYIDRILGDEKRPRQ